MRPRAKWGCLAALGCCLLLIATFDPAVAPAWASVGEREGEGRRALERAKLSLKGITQHNKLLGNRDAPVRLVIFSDPQSPLSRLWQVRVLPALVKKYVRLGKLQIEWRAFTVLGSASLAGEDFIAAAGRQNHLWDVLDDVMANQGEENSGWLNRSLLETIGSVIPGFDVTKAVSVAGSRSVAQEIVSDEHMGQRYGLVGVPFVLLARRGRPLKPLDFGSYTPEAFEVRIHHLLSEH